ncbi:hypothetical protein 043JT007_203 [Bacillus phage 043JT007]|nr:hypothetical protein 043JT007_203 [Bacillus phage 043JT007]
MDKQSFSKLTEDLEKMNEQVSKSEESAEVENKLAEDGLTVEPVAGEVADEGAEPVKEEPAEEPEVVEVTPEQPAPEEESPEDEPKEDEPQEDKSSEDDKGDDEPVSKADEKEEKEEKKEDKKKESKDGKKEEKKDEGVKKSESDEISVSGTEILGAFESIVKSFSSLKEQQSGLEGRLSSIEKSITDLMNLMVKPEVVIEGSDKEEVEEAEQVEKSQPELSEGKAETFISKSTEGDVSVPEATQEDEVEEAPFNPYDHIDTATDFYIQNASEWDRGKQASFREAIHRVKRGQPTQADIALFKEIAEN